MSPKIDEDLTGRSHLAYNVLVSWLVHMVVLIAGFVIPRQIDDSLGQSALGVWDFGWAIVKYMGYAGLGVTSALTRYSAKLRAENKLDELNATASSVFLMQLFFASLMMIVTFALVYFVPGMLLGDLGVDSNEVAWVIGLLGASVVVQLAFDPARGLLTGFHRWDINNAIIAAADISAAIGMVAVLLLGGGLMELGVVYFLVTCCASLARIRMAHSVFPQLSLSMYVVSLERCRVMLLFGIKTTFLALPQLAAIQTASIMLAGSAGPGALAIFARPLALVRHVDVLVRKFAFMLTPISSSLIGMGKWDELRELVLSAGRQAAFLAVLMLSVFAVFGNDVVAIWMGDDYVKPDIIPILAIGMFLPISQSVAMRILIGIDRHGRAALLSLFGTLLAIGATSIWAFATGWSPAKAAVVVAISLSAGPGIVVPAFLCFYLKISIRHYVGSIFIIPLAVAFLLIAFMTVPALVWPTSQGVASAIGTVTGLSIAAILGWFYVLTEAARQRLISYASKLRPRALRVQTSSPKGGTSQR